MFLKKIEFQIIIFIMGSASGGSDACTYRTKSPRGYINNMKMVSSVLSISSYLGLDSGLPR